MARRVVSLIERAPGVPLGGVPVLEANAYAVAEDVDLAVVLRGDAVAFALTGGPSGFERLAGIPLPRAVGAQDLRGLLESGVAVHAEAAALDERGLTDDVLLPGVRRCDPPTLAGLLRSADAVLTW